MNQTNNQSTNSKSQLASVFYLVAGLLGGALLTGLYFNFSGHGQSASAKQDTHVEADEAPLYWVAPMDPNFKRDQPGKSPMGMDLVPVYANKNSTNSNSPGTVSIASNIVNNLGVRTAKVAYSTMHVPIQTIGYVGYNQDRLIHIHARAQGWVDKLYVTASGEPVEKDQPLYALYSPELVNAQEEYLLAVNRGNSALTNAALSRLVALQMPKQAIQTLKQTQKVLQTVEFRSPQAGVVDNLNIREGFFVNPERTLMSIASLDDVWVETEVFERLAGQVEVGLPVTMSLDYLPGESWQGVVDYIYPTLNEQTRTLRARLRFSNSQQKLKPNMFAQVVIHTKPSARSLWVPSEAVIRTRTQNRVVLALGDGQFKSVAVKLGTVVHGQAQILDGLEQGDTIVTSAQFLLDSESSINSDFSRMTALSNKQDSHDMSGMVKQDSHANHEGMDHSNMNHGNMDSHDMSDKDKQDSQDKQDSHANHEGMDHSNMNHDNMDSHDMSDMDKQDSHANHEGMDHSNMNHGNMDSHDMSGMDKQDSHANHEGMDHSNMNHENMDSHDMSGMDKQDSHANHEGMDHSNMNHGNMDSHDMSDKDKQDSHQNHAEKHQGMQHD
ncbi:efflux RND transporter periplasmic adaptor subunit [Aliiglaciecola sp. NS0011-25]|uniref:efflux RND transporter periplasmic adaptor subunit n=1 Tax=Aliiglaciecola sp. NS0011-25 TaxID=3127654 RepID=UPI0031089784